MPRIFDKYWTKNAIVEQMKAKAELYKGRFPLANNKIGLAIVNSCLAQYEQPGLITTLIYTADDGMHAVGWWKNPDYARCYHLSIAYWYPDSTVAPKQNKATQEWVDLFFHPHANWVWTEPPYSAIGKRKNVWHYRLFADEHWQPRLAEGEVYSTLKTERGWLSYSELQDRIKRELQEEVNRK